MSLAKLLSAAAEDKLPSSKIDQITEELRTALTLANSEVLPSNFSIDLTALITNSVNLLQHLSAPTFPSREVLDQIHRVRSILYSLESYVRNAQVSYTGFCVVNSRSGKMYPNLCFTYDQAEQLRSTLSSAFGMPLQDLSVETVIYSSTKVNQPLSVPANLIPAPTAPLTPPSTPAPVEPELPPKMEQPSTPAAPIPVSEAAPVKD